MKKLLLTVSVLLFINPGFTETGTNYEDINYFISSSSVSSYAGASGKDTYVKENLLDGMMSTCWKTQFSSSNKPWIEFKFKEAVKLSSINIANGNQHWSYDTGYYDESRIKRATVIFNNDDKNPLVIIFKDKEGFTSFTASYKSIKSIKIIIDEIFEGSNSKDLAVSDIVFWGETNEKPAAKNDGCPDSDLEASLKGQTVYIKSAESGKIYFQEWLNLDGYSPENIKRLRLEQSSRDRYLEVAIGGIDCTVFIFGYYDCCEKKWLFRFDNNDNTQFFSSSPDGRYVAIDTGTSACGRGLDVFDIKTGRHVLATGYKPMTTYFPEWEGDRLVYYRTAGKKVDGMPEIPANEYKAYVRKIYFEKGFL